MSNLICILGAGFSRNCGFPLANDINDKFSNLNIDNLLHFGSGEWKWNEHGYPDSVNGKGTVDRIGLSLLLNEYILTYKATFTENKQFDYEEFLDWFIENSSNQILLQKLIESVNKKIKKEYDYPNNDLHYLRSSQERVYREKIYDCFNELIADLLWRDYDSELRSEDYLHFITFISKYDKKYIFTLNHDLLLEFILNKYQKNFSDGFSSLKSPLLGEKSEPLSIHQNIYDADICIFKIHGSVNYYKYDFFNQNGVVLNRTGQYLFFKPQTYRNKHISKRINPETGETLQNMNFNITPQFLTGKNKPTIISGSTFYKDLFLQFENKMKSKSDLLIIGYSFRDFHVNQIIERSIKENIINSVYNVNRSETDFFNKIGYNSIYNFKDNITEIKHWL